jgi:hypothetical protein
MAACKHLSLREPDSIDDKVSQDIRSIDRRLIGTITFSNRHRSGHDRPSFNVPGSISGIFSEEKKHN